MHNLDPDAPAFAQAMLEQVVDAYPSGSSTVKAYVAITFGAANRKGSKKRQAEEMGHELATRLPGLTAALQATGAGAAHPLTAQDLCEVVRVAYDPASAVLIDEAQFLTALQVDQLMEIALIDDVPVLAYGIRTDFRTVSFPGSRRLLEIAHSLEELKTICRCGRKAIFNARKVGESFVFDGDQVAIDSGDVTYESLCGQCYLAAGGRLPDR